MVPPCAATVFLRSFTTPFGRSCIKDTALNMWNNWLFCPKEGAQNLCRRQKCEITNEICALIEGMYSLSRACTSFQEYDALHATLEWRSDNSCCLRMGMASRASFLAPKQGKAAPITHTSSKSYHAYLMHLQWRRCWMLAGVKPHLSRDTTPAGFLHLWQLRHALAAKLLTLM